MVHIHYGFEKFEKSGKCRIRIKIRIRYSGKKRACLVRATVEHELIVSYLELKNAIFLVLTLIKHSLGMSEQLSL